MISYDIMSYRSRGRGCRRGRGLAMQWRQETFFRNFTPKKCQAFHCIARPPRRQARPRLRYDIIWYDMISYDIMSYDMILYDIVSYDIIWYHTIWYDIIWYDTMWYYIMWYDMIPPRLEMRIFSITSTENGNFQHHLDWKWPFSASPRLDLLPEWSELVKNHRIRSKCASE